MKRKLNICLTVALLVVCVCSLAIGVYAAKQATLSLSTTIGFNAQNCKVSVYGTISGHATSVNSAPASSFSYLKKGSTPATPSDPLTMNGTASSLTFGTVYFSDLGTGIDEPKDITISLTITNQSNFPILIEDTSVDNIYTNYAIVCNNPLHVLNSKDASVTITYTLKPTKTDGVYNEITSSLQISFGINITKLDTNVVGNISDGWGIKGSTIIQVPPKSSYGSDILVIPTNIYDSSTDSSTSCISLGNGTDPITNLSEYSKVVAHGFIGTGAYAFNNCTNLVAVAISNSMCGNYAFQNCTKLKSIYFASIISMGTDVFNGCTSLCSATIGSTFLASLPDNTFKNCSSLCDVTIANSIKTIGTGAFSGCSSLSNITLPTGLTSIEVSSFSGCTSLRAISIPNTTQNIKANAFVGCTSLRSVDFPTSLTSLGMNSFANCSNLRTVVLPERLNSMEENSFFGCSNLRTVVLPEVLTSMGPAAFRNCSSLTSITIPNNSQLTAINSRAFSGCTSLTSITIPEGVTSIGIEVFNNCTSLTSVTIPEGVTSIGSGAFRYCSSLTSINIPSSVTIIDDFAFASCSGLSSITVHPNNTTYKSEGNAILSKDGTDLYVGCKTTIIPASVTTIGDSAFSGCTGLYSINMPEDVNSLIIPECVTTIGNSAFFGCANLRSVTIPASVTKIGRMAFNACTNLTSATFKTTSVWWYSGSSTATSGTTISATGLASQSTAATYLRSTYASYYWGRT